MKRLLCIWLPNWPIQRIVVAQPALRDCALVLQTRVANRGERVVACSPQAAAHGIRVGMSVAETGALWNAAQCPYDSAADQAELRRLAEWCEQFSPSVGMEEPPNWGRDLPTWRESLLLDVTGLGRWFGSEERLAEQVVAAFAHRGYCTHIAIADTLGAAWALAHGLVGAASRVAPDSEHPAKSRSARRTYSPQAPEHSSVPSPPERSLSVPSPPERTGLGPDRALGIRIGVPGGEGQGEGGFARHRNSHQAPPHYRIVPPGQHLAALGPLPVELLRLNERAVDLLHQLGIFSVQSLQGLPRAGLSSRLGQEVLQRLDQAAGIVDEILLPHRPAPVFAAQWSLEHPTDQRLVLEQGLRQVIEQLARQLAEKNRAALQVEVRVDCISPDASCSHPAQRFGLQLFRPLAEAEHLLDLINMQWEQTRLPGPVHQIGAYVLLAVPREQQQQGLFDTPQHTRQREFARLVDRLSSRLGPHQVLRPREEAEVQPECACHFIPLAGEVSSAASRANTAARSREPPGPNDRPLRLYRPPHPLHVLAVGPEGPPVRFQERHQWHEVAEVWGPERIETGWWRGRTIRRDYYRVETRSGQRFWLFRELNDGHWFLHGTFT